MVWSEKRFLQSIVWIINFSFLCSSFSFSSEYFPISFETYSSTHELLLDFQASGDLTVIFGLLISSLILLWPENLFWTSHLLRLVLWSQPMIYFGEYSACAWKEVYSTRASGVMLSDLGCRLQTYSCLEIVFQFHLWGKLSSELFKSPQW